MPLTIVNDDPVRNRCYRDTQQPGTFDIFLGPGIELISEHHDGPISILTIERKQPE